jgi:hypothetical protein
MLSEALFRGSKLALLCNFISFWDMMMTRHEDGVGFDHHASINHHGGIEAFSHHDLRLSKRVNRRTQMP